MLGIYLFFGIVGGGLLLLSLVAGADGDGDGDGGDAGAEHGDGGDHPLVADAEHPGIGELVFSLFRPRNLTFGAAGFGLTGTVLTVLQANPLVTVLAASGLGAGFFFLSHVVFTLLQRSETGTDALSDTQLMGERARVQLPIAPGRPGKVACLLGGREAYLTARLAPGHAAPIGTGEEVIVVRVADGVAEVLPPDVYERQLPP